MMATAAVATVILYYDFMYLHCPDRFHPDHIQEFLTKRKRKSEGWKCAVRIVHVLADDADHRFLRI